MEVYGAVDDVIVGRLPIISHSKLHSPSEQCIDFVNLEFGVRQWEDVPCGSACLWQRGLR